MHTYRRDNHRCEHSRCPKRRKQTKEQQNTTKELTQTSYCCKRLSWTKAQTNEKPSGPFKTIAPKPPEKLLRPMSANCGAKQNPHHQDSHINRHLSSSFSSFPSHTLHSQPTFSKLRVEE